MAVTGDTVACYPDLTVRDHLELVAVAHGVADPRPWIDQVLADRRLTDHADQLPSALSSGQTQALHLAAALVRPRDLLVLDEPEQRLDPASRTRLGALLLRGETDDDGVAVLLATHQAELVHAVADHVVVLEDGRVVAEGGPDVLDEAAAHPRGGPPDEQPRPARPGGAGRRGRDGAGSTGAAWTAADDRTSETLDLLRGKRRAHRSRRNRDLAVTGYAVLLMAVGYGGTLGYRRLVRRLERLTAQDATAEAVRSALPAVLMLPACALALLAVRDALWRAPPVLVPRCDLDWLLAPPGAPQPGAAARAFRLSAALTAAAGALCAIGGAVLLRLSGLAELGPALALCLPGGVCLPCRCWPARSPSAWSATTVRPAGPRALTPYAVLLLLLLVLQAVVRARGGAAVGPPGGGRTVVRPLGLGRATGPARGGRARAQRDGPGPSRCWPPLPPPRSATHSGRSERSPPGGCGRAPPPRRPSPRCCGRPNCARPSSPSTQPSRMVPPAACAGCPCRARPGSLSCGGTRWPCCALRGGWWASAALWTAAASGAAGLAVASAGAGRIAALAMALALGWFAVGRLAETARLEADDTRRSSWSPFRLGSLMLQHAITPAVVGAVLALAAAVPFALRGGEWALLLMPLCAPPFAAAARCWPRCAVPCGRNCSPWGW